MDANVTRCGAGNLFLVCDHNQCHAAGLLEAGQQLHDSRGVRAVQISGRLIGQQNRRIISQRPGYRYALPFPSGKLTRVLAHAMFQPHFAQQCLGTLPTCAAAIGHSEHGSLHVFNSTQCRQQVERLKDEADMVAAIGVEANRRSQSRTAEQDIAAGGGIKSAEQLKQGGLPTSTLSTDS